MSIWMRSLIHRQLKGKITKKRRETVLSYVTVVVVVLSVDEDGQIAV
jgi:hypothetical protein